LADASVAKRLQSTGKFPNIFSVRTNKWVQFFNVLFDSPSVAEFGHKAALMLMLDNFFCCRPVLWIRNSRLWIRIRNWTRTLLKSINEISNLIIMTIKIH
jgi:hypothetical protein